MGTYQLPTSNISPLDALWAHFVSLPKTVQLAFIGRLKELNQSSSNEKVSNKRKAKVVKPSYGLSDRDLENLFEDNGSSVNVSEPDIPSLIQGQKGKTLDNLKKWM